VMASPVRRRSTDSLSGFDIAFKRIYQADMLLSRTCLRLFSAG
jgi:hypothetical protein